MLWWYFHYHFMNTEAGRGERSVQDRTMKAGNRQNSDEL